jgi:hypothetical protein
VRKVQLHLSRVFSIGWKNLTFPSSAYIAAVHSRLWASTPIDIIALRPWRIFILAQIQFTWPQGGIALS